MSEHIKFQDVALGDCCEIISGSTPSRLINEYWNGDINWFTPKDLSGIKSKYVTTSPEKITQSGIDSCSAKLLPPKSLLLSSRAPIGHIAISTIEACTNQGFKSLIPNEGVNVEYLFYAIKKIVPQLQDLGNGATFKEISKATLSRVTIPLPSLPEQQKIASILDAADNLRQKDQQLIEKYTALSQSLFLEMFGDPVSNPMGWDKSIAENFIDLLTGFAFKSADYSSNKDDINLCGGLIITPSGIEWDKSNYWQRDRLDGLEKYRIIDGDIVMAMDRPWISSGFKIHKITKNDKESFLVQRTARIRGKGINQDFLYFLFKHNAFEKQANTTETTVPHISPKDIRKYELIIPPINLQNQFAERIQSIETQKQLALANLEKSAALFNSLLQRAFKGELTA